MRARIFFTKLNITSQTQFTQGATCTTLLLRLTQDRLSLV